MARPVYLRSGARKDDGGNLDWGTPKEFFDALNREFHFTLDAAAERHNAKCRRYISPKKDALSLEDWGVPGEEVIFLNPPYKNMRGWLDCAIREASKGSTVVCLIPSRTGTKWWYDKVVKQAKQIRFVVGRLKFERPGDNPGATFDSAVVIYGPGPKDRKFQIYIDRETGEQVG